MKRMLPGVPALRLLLLCAAALTACSKGGDTPPPVVDTAVVRPPSFDINSIRDTYEDVAPVASYLRWGPYNVHDPAIMKVGDTYYSYSTDAAFGTAVRPGLQIRKSKDLVQWHYVGWVFNGLPQKGAAYIRQNGSQPFESLWAPYVIKVGSEYRLYYSLSSPVHKLSVIGLATAASPEGPWVEKDLVVTSRSDLPMTNAIDPSVLVDGQGQHWMYYGSAYDGIYVVKLNGANGLAQTSGDKGKRIAQRGFTGRNINSNIEAPEIIYNEELKKYYLFISYDWLETKYNVRVGRSDKPEGPFLDYYGRDINTEDDHGPMILAPYQFNGHSGWQGTAHCAVFGNGSGQYFMAHQGRPGVNKFFMVMHVRKMYWTPDGWPVVSPERYAALEESPITAGELAGEWEQIVFRYNIVPGYANEQLSPDFSTSVTIRLDAGGTVNGNAGDKWTYAAPWLEVKWSNGKTDKVRVDRERDWENKKNTIIFSGLNNEGGAVWGKKK